MSILAWVILGLIAGGVASLLVPGRTPGGVIGAIVVGVVGALIGGWLATLFGAGSVSGLDWYSILLAIVGAVVLLVLSRLLRTTTP
jgi:uncharacterized membrane protein YeaQ/YmgE (transglycosylase-associated protein family)